MTTLTSDEVTLYESQKVYAQREAKHKPSSYSLSLICSFDETKNRRKFYRRKDCIKQFCNDLNELVTEIINYKEEEMTTLTSDEVTLYKSQKVYAKEGFVMMKIRKKNLSCTKKSEIIVITLENLEELLKVIAIYNTKYLKKFLQYFIIVQHMIIIYN